MDFRGGYNHYSGSLVAFLFEDDLVESLWVAADCMICMLQVSQTSCNAFILGIHIFNTYSLVILSQELHSYKSSDQKKTRKFRLIYTLDGNVLNKTPIFCCWGSAWSFLGDPNEICSCSESPWRASWPNTGRAKASSPAVWWKHVTRSTLWLFNIAMGNGPFIEVYLLKVVIFHGYVK